MKKTVHIAKANKKGGEVWNDNCVELYVAPMTKNGMNYQFLVNDRGEWSCHIFGAGRDYWQNPANIKVKVDRLKDRWIAQIAIPYASIGGRADEIRFNPIRTHRAGGKGVEFSTYSPLALYGVWHIPDNYGTVIFK